MCRLQGGEGVGEIGAQDIGTGSKRGERFVMLLPYLAREKSV